MSNIIDSIQLSGTVYTIQGSGGTVSSAITSGDTNAVAGGAVYDKFNEVEQVTARALIDLNESKQDTLSAGTNITISGNVISATGGGNATVELTQAEYDALVSAGTVSADTYYIITDATPIDLSPYWTSAQTQSAITQATSGKVNTSSVVSSVTSASTDSEIPTAKAVYNAIPTGGSASYSAGRGIDITNDTISFNLPISAGTGSNSIIENSPYNKATGNYTHAEGLSTSATSVYSHAEGYQTLASGQYAHAEGLSTTAQTYCHSEGYQTNANAYYSHAEGYQTLASGSASHTEGGNTSTSNSYEHASGYYNVSNKANTTFGDSGNTLFSVGNGTADDARHNAFEIRQNGDCYLNNGTSDVKLQDYLQIKVVKLTQSAYDALSPDYDSNTLYIIKD